MGERAGDLRLDRRRERGDHRERGPLLRRHLGERSVDRGPVEAAVEGDHLAVEAVQRAEPEVAVLGELGEGEVAVVGAVEQGGDRRGLEEDVRLAPLVQFALAHRLHVEGPDPSLVEHGGQSATAWAAPPT